MNISTQGILTAAVIAATMRQPLSLDLTPQQCFARWPNWMFDVADIWCDRPLIFSTTIHLDQFVTPFPLRHVTTRTHVSSPRTRGRSRPLGSATSVNTRCRRNRSMWRRCSILHIESQCLTCPSLPSGEWKWEHASHGDDKSGQPVPLRLRDVPRKTGDATPPEALPDDNAQTAPRPTLLQRPCTAWRWGPRTGKL